MNTQKFRPATLLVIAVALLVVIWAAVIGAILIWRQNMTAIWVTAMLGGLADIGYFVFLDIPGYVNFMPGTLMTIFSGSAIVLSFWVWWTHSQTEK